MSSEEKVDVKQDEEKGRGDVVRAFRSRCDLTSHRSAESTVSLVDELDCSCSKAD